MSGGSYEYIYERIENFGYAIRADTPQRAVFKQLVFRVADAARDIEWVDSGDQSPGDENEAIAACFSMSYPQALLCAGATQLRAAAEAAIEACKAVEDGGE